MLQPTVQADRGCMKLPLKVCMPLLDLFSLSLLEIHGLFSPVLISAWGNSLIMYKFLPALLLTVLNQASICRSLLPSLLKRTVRKASLTELASHAS